MENYDDITINHEKLYHALYDSRCNKQDQLEFKRGDLVEISTEYDEWWVACLHGKFGLVPKSYFRPAFTLVESG